jgi:hypothetical protein
MKLKKKFSSAALASGIVACEIKNLNSLPDFKKSSSAFSLAGLES